MVRAGLCAFISLIAVAQTPSPLGIIGTIMGPDSRPMVAAVAALVPVGGRSGLASVQEGRSDRDGRFVLKAVPGRYGLTVTAPGCMPHFRNLEVKDGETAAPVSVRLEKGGYRVRGRLLPAAGFTLEMARLGFSKVSQDDGDQFFGTIENGRFEVTLAPGTYWVAAEAKGQTGRQRFEVGNKDLDTDIRLSAEPWPAGRETRDWIKEHAVPLHGVQAGQGFSDMQPLKAMVGGASVVALGEATHGTREFFQLKHRMLEFLASEMGFTVFAIEANLPEAHAVDAYLQTGEGDPAKALAGLYFWTWNTEEVLDMIRWMRAYNLDPAHTKKLRFYGVDMQTETVAFSQASTWLAKVAPVEVGRLADLKGRMAQLPSPNGGKPTPESRTAWAAISREIEALMGRLKSDEDNALEFDRQRQNLRVIAQYADMGADPGWGGEARDKAMAANVQWIQAREHGAKIVLWAHNGHISVRPGSLGGTNPMGWHLRQSLGRSYFPMGFSFLDGSFQAKNADPKNRSLRVFEVQPQPMGTLDSALASTGASCLALDLQARPGTGEVKRWLESPQGTWSIGALFNPQQAAGAVMKLPVTESYDALLFVAHTTPARPVGGRN